MLNRRDFLRFGGTGLSGIALLSLLAEQKLLASGAPIRPSGLQKIPMRPSAAFRTKSEERARDFLLRRLQPSRKLGLQTGADQAPRPADAGSDKLITFQGENGNLDEALVGIQTARPIRQNDFRHAAPSRRSWRTTVLHPFDDRQEQHARPGGKPDEHRLHAGWFSQHGRVGQLMRSARKIRICPRSSRFRIRAAFRRSGRTIGIRAFCPPVFQGTAFQRG